MSKNPEGQEIQYNEFDGIEEEQEAEEEIVETIIQEEEEDNGEEEEEKVPNQYADTVFDRHKLTLKSYLIDSPKKGRKEKTNEVQTTIETDPPQIYDDLVKRYGPKLLDNLGEIDNLNEKKKKRNDISQPERMTNDQLRESIQDLAMTIGSLNEEIAELKESIGTLQQQYVVYQQKKKEREMAALSAHAKKSSRSPKNKPAASPSPKKKPAKK